ncbi:16S rRNA (guanine(527)-N(7))-methyltransferase RsmG [Kaarinaea lacus]
MGLDSVLSSGLSQLGLDCSPAVRARLRDYVTLLDKWNRVYNLTAVRDPEEMVTRHLLDSLAIYPFLQGSRVLDVGTGAGLPGIPLAIVDSERHPRREYVLLDSNSKKTRFVQQAKAELGLDNVTVVHQRSEEYHPGQLYDVVVSRAFASIADMLKNSAQHCAKNGVILAMKGVDPAEELMAIPDGFVLVSVNALDVPGIDGQRHLVCIKPATQG